MNQQSIGGTSEKNSQNSSPEVTLDTANDARSRVNGLQVLSVLLVLASSVVAVLLSVKNSKSPSVSVALSTSEIPGWLVLSLQRKNIGVTHEEDLPGKVLENE